VKQGFFLLKRRDQKKGPRRRGPYRFCFAPRIGTPQNYFFFFGAAFFFAAAFLVAFFID
jgi:hypothetical protein